MTPEKPPRSILIAGGGTAGWLAACYLAKVFGHGPTSPRITLIESPDIGTIGVGEGSIPTIRTTLQTLGIDEAEFLRECSATFKQGIRFVDWEAEGSAYSHPFEAPYFTDGAGLAPYWLLQDKATRRPFAEAVTLQTGVANAGRAPKRIHEGGYFGGRMNYAYHFDAGKFGRLLARYARAYGVTHLEGRITEVKTGSHGISSLVSPEHGELSADFYIDCTGFSALLIGQALGAPFLSVKDILLTDSAVAIQLPYADGKEAIPSHTLATAHEAGWTWDIGLDSRRGVGYVYSSAHSSDERALEILRGYLRRYLGDKADNAQARLIRFDTGYRTQQWVKNCCAIGLSAGFYEPLEATGIMMIEVAIGLLVDLFPHDGPLDAAADLFNERMRQRYEKTAEFLKLHYCLSKRPEPFWRANADPATLPDNLKRLLDMWRSRPPSRFDTLSDIDIFPVSSYQYILYGLNYPTDLSAQAGVHSRIAAAEQTFARILAFTEGAVRDLPLHRDLIEQVYARGFSTPAAPRALKIQ
ncbi:MAG: tryptophan 7-halogenase [Asticcacaulis sp.]|uniref:tryptophan halogenase family protein n=1 Tax=Asticcacaulis sp. TaxID=1872648 RepID=UPI0039E2F2C5